MTSIEMLGFNILCFIGLLLCLYLAVAKCYQTGVPGSIGLGLMALALGVFWLETLSVTYELTRMTGFLVTGLVIFLSQHVYRVITKNRADRRDAAKRLRAGPPRAMA